MIMGIFTFQRITTLVICICISCSVHSQTDFRSFRLDTFKLPDIHFSSLTVFGAIYGRHTDTDRPGDGLEINDQSRFSPNIELSYNRYVNSPRLQSLSFLNLDQSLDIRREEGVSGIRKTTYVNTGISASISNRYYNGNRFFHLGGFASFNYGYQHQEFETNIDKDKSYTIRLEPVIGVGKGRLEPVSDVAMALFILQDAADLGVDIAGVTTEEVYAFASLMAEVRNRRILDFRRMRIAELRDLYSHMLAKGWVLRDDPGFFTVLTDNWTYTDVFFRQAGKRWTYSLTPRYFLTKNFFSPIDGERQEIGAGITIDYQKHRPVNLYKDNRRSHTLSVNYGHGNNETLFYSPTGDYAQLKFDNSIGRAWYPNNRTNITGSINLGYRYYRFFEPQVFISEEDQHVVNAGAGFQAFYFLSYSTQLSLDAQLQYGYSSGGAFVPIVNGFFATPEISGIHAAINARIVVALF